MNNADDQQNVNPRKRWPIYVENVLMILAIPVLFWLGGFRRSEMWAQIVLGGILFVMIVIFVRRTKRINRAVKEKNDQDFSSG